MTTVEIEIEGIDYWSVTLFSTARFNSQVNGAGGECYLRLRDPDRTLEFATGNMILLKIDGEAVWRGFLSQWKRVYVFPAINVDAFGETRFMDLLGVDINVLFNKRIVFNQDTPEVVEGKLYPPFQPDAAVIADLVADYLDLSSDTIDTSTFVDDVGNITEDQEGRAWSAGDTWGQAMGSIAMLPAAIFYLRPTLTGADLVYCDVDTPTATMAMSDVV